MDYSPKFNVLQKHIAPHVAENTIWRPYANMRYSKFLEQTNITEYSDLVSSILQTKPFVLACGSNRRDFTGAVLAAEKTGMNLVIADPHTYEELHLEEKPLLKVVQLSHGEFNVLLTHADYVIVPASLPQPTPVGIGTIARVKMARKIPIGVNNTGIDMYITHGVDGYFVPDPTAEHEAKYGSYQKIFEELRDENRRREIEGKINILAESDEYAGQQMTRIGRCVATHAISSKEGTIMYELHHVNNCHACGRTDWCDFWHVSNSKIGIKGKYGRVGAALEDSCEKVKNAAITQVVRNPRSGKMYVATACSES